MTYQLYVILLLLVGIERLYEMRLSSRHATWSFERGGKEFGQAHFPYMVAIHTALLLGSMIEVPLFDRPFIPVLGWPCIGLLFLCQALRYWIIVTLGPRWNTRVIVVPGLPLIHKGPYRYCRHPNYVGVVLEGLAIPLIHSAYFTALFFTLANAVVLYVRIRCENRALSSMTNKSGLSHHV